LYTGGGFKIGNSTMYMDSFIHIIEHLRKTKGLDVRIFSIDYDMMPDVQYAKTKEDAMKGYMYLIQDLEINPKKVIVGK
jgi:acetyl esterase/lipase